MMNYGGIIFIYHLINRDFEEIIKYTKFVCLALGIVLHPRHIPANGVYLFHRSFDGVFRIVVIFLFQSDF